MVVGSHLCIIPAVCTGRDILDHYFNLMEDVSKKDDLKGKLGCLFSLYETGIPLQYHPSRRIVVQVQKHVNALAFGNKTHHCPCRLVSALGYAMPLWLYIPTRISLQSLFSGRLMVLFMGLLDR